MKSEPHSLLRSDPARQTRALTGQSRDRSENVLIFPSPQHRARRGLAKKQPSRAIDLENLLRLSQQLYAHALTLQEVIRTEGKVTYEVLRPGYDRQAARQFEVFNHSLKRPAGLRQRRKGARR
jgi:hypothetical protein